MKQPSMDDLRVFYKFVDERLARLLAERATPTCSEKNRAVIKSEAGELALICEELRRRFPGCADS